MGGDVEGSGPTAAEQMIGAGFGAVVGAVTGPAGLVIGPVAALPMAMLTHRVFDEFRHWRENYAALVVQTAAEDLGLDSAAFESEVTSTKSGFTIFGEAVLAGGNTLSEQKVRALGTALANGLRDDQARVDSERLMIGALAAIEEPHMKVLAMLGQSTSACTLKWLDDNVLGMRYPEISPVLSVLERQGLIDNGQDNWGRDVTKEINRLRSPSRVATSDRPTPLKHPAEESWLVTTFGLRCLGYLGENLPDRVKRRLLWIDEHGEL